MNNLSSNELSQQQLKEELADKVLRGKKLSKSEKESIYRILTGKEPRPKKRGRPKLDVRNYRMAIAFLQMMDEDPNKSHIYKERIREQYSRYKLSKNDNTFYAALNKGIDILQARAESCIERANSNIELGANDEELLKLKSAAETQLKLIYEFRKRNEHLKKKR